MTVGDFVVSVMPEGDPTVLFLLFIALLFAIAFYRDRSFKYGQQTELMSI
jgi:hypothetical protein